MTLSDLLPDKETLGGLENITTQLEARRFKGWLSLVAAFLSTALAVINFVAGNEYLGKIFQFFKPSAKTHPLLEASLPVVAFVFFFLFVLLRFTGVRLQQSKQPFRYTVYIKDFKQLASESECRIVEGAKQLELLPSDLMERVQLRLRRFSLLPPETHANAEPSHFTSHFEIEADYAVRKEKHDGPLFLYVWPRVRAGASSNAFTVASTVRLPLRDDTGHLSPELYQRLVERVYSSVTTEIYKQIEADLREKMELFPTDAFRALARYIEGKDFENSNTIDAYDRAIAMYRTSLSELASSWQQRTLLNIGRKLPFLARYRWTGVPFAMLAQARTNLGLARCLIYRRLVSEMSGRPNLPIFEVRRLLFGKPGADSSRSAFALSIACFNARVPAEYRVSPALFDAVRMLDPDTGSEQEFATQLTDFCRAISSESKPGRAAIFDKISEDEELCETAAISALAQSRLADSASARRFLQFAEAVELRSRSTDASPLILLVKAELQPDLPAAIRLLNEAAKQNSFSEIVLFRLARKSDLLAHDKDEITPQNVDHLANGYENVLKVNPGNIASRICQGYLYWLTDQPVKAAESFEAGIEMETIAARTYVGDLKYGLARVKAEQSSKSSLSDSNALFRQAILADPSVSSFEASSEAPVNNVYFDRMNLKILERFERFYDKVNLLPNREEFSLIHSAALNDYANACLAYYLRFDVGTARETFLLKSLVFYREAVNIRNDLPFIQNNLLTACGWASDMINAPSPSWMQQLVGETSDNLMGPDTGLPPGALAYVVSVNRQNTLGLEKRIDELKKRKADLKSRIANLEKEGSEAKKEKVDVLEPMEQPERLPRERDAKGPEYKQATEPIADVPARQSIDAQGDFLLSKGSAGTETSKSLAEESEERGHAHGQAKEQGANPAKRQKEESINEVLERTEKLKGLRQELEDKEQELQQATEQKTAEKTRRKEAAQRLLESSARLRPLKLADTKEKEPEQATKQKTDEGPREKAADQRPLDSPKLRPFKLADAKDIDWDSFDEKEVYTFAAYASFLCDDPETKTEGFERCDLVCQTFYPEYLVLLQWLTLSSKHKTKAVKKVDAVLKQNRKEDVRNFQLKKYALDQISQWPGSQAALKKAKPICDELPLFHYYLANAAEGLAKKPGASSHVAEQLAEMAEASRLAPLNWTLRQKVRDGLAPQIRKILAVPADSYPLPNRDLPSLIECEFDRSSIDCIIFDGNVSRVLRDRESEMRNRLQTDLGIVLPVIKYRYADLGTSQFRLLLRELPLETHSFGTPQVDDSVRRKQLTSEIEAVARENAASLYSLAECSAALEKLPATLEFEPIVILTDANATTSLTLVLKTLLSERLPVGALSELAPAFSRCYEAGEGIAATATGLRGLPFMAEQLPGNSAEQVPISLPLDIAESLGKLVGEAGLDAPPEDWRELRAKLRDFALLEVLKQPKATLVSDPSIRPLVAKACAGIGLPVLATNEIGPELSSRASHGKATAQAAG